jgi:hypothetical protein
MSVKNRDPSDMHPDPEKGSCSTAIPGRRRRADRGPPGAETLRDLAETYMQSPRALRPELVENGLLSRSTPDPIAVMAEDFRQSLLSGSIKPFAVSVANPLWEAFAGLHLRYSEQNSNI